MTTRRQFLHTSAALAAAVTVLPYRLAADGHSAANSFASATGDVVVTPVSHATFVMQTPQGTIYVDPVGSAADYAEFPDPDLILVTHEHGDHFAADVLEAVTVDTTVLVANPAVHDKLSGAVLDQCIKLANNETAELDTITINAIPAYNTTPERLNFHPRVRDNGYVVTVDGLRIYISGDTEDIPEMRALNDIDIAFVCMNLPFTMDAKSAADAVSEFAPTYVYPYHYRGRDNGTQDPAEFAEMLQGEIETKFGNWYG